MTKAVWSVCVLVALVLLCAGVLRADDGPAPLTEVESLRIQNANLTRAILQRELDDFQKQIGALKADLERARPGYVWDAESGKFAAVPKK